MANTTNWQKRNIYGATNIFHRRGKNAKRKYHILRNEKSSRASAAVATSQYRTNDIIKFAIIIFEFALILPTGARTPYENIKLSTSKCCSIHFIKYTVLSSPHFVALNSPMIIAFVDAPHAGISCQWRALFYLCVFIGAHIHNTERHSSTRNGSTRIPIGNINVCHRYVLVLYCIIYKQRCKICECKNAV